MPTKLDPKLLKETLSSMRDWYDLDLTREQLLQVLEKDRPLLNEINMSGMDTCIREALVDSIGRFLGLEVSWPVNADSEAYALAYFKTFKEKAEAAGFKLVLGDNWGPEPEEAIGDDGFGDMEEQ